MTKIDLLSVEIEGFKSYAKATSVTFGQPPGLCFLGGRNEQTERLGANGAGKSALFDAIFWCLYGTSLRDKRSSDLLSHGASAMQVEVCLRVGGQVRKIYRSSPPNRLLLDNTPVEQADINALVGLSKQRFRHSVIFGQGVPLFYDLSSPERGALLDEVLDLGVWLSLADFAGRQAKAIDSELAKASEARAYTEGILAGLPEPEKLLDQAAKWQALHDAEVEEQLHALSELENEAKNLHKALQHHTDSQSELRNNLAALADPAALQDALVKLRVHHDLQLDQLRSTRELIQFYRTHETCPTCQQHMPNRAQTLVDLGRNELEQLRTTNRLAHELGEHIAQNAALRDKRHAIEAAIARCNEELAHAKADLQSVQREIRFAERKCEKLLNEDNPYTAQIASEQAKRTETENGLRQLQELVDQLNTRRNRVDYWRDGFRQIRLFLVKQTLQFIELAASNVASAFGLNDWRITLATEQETKSGTLRPGIHITVSEGEGGTRDFSPGEEQRIRLCVALGLASVIQQMAGVSWGIEVFDEPSNWLSVEGVDDLLTLLEYRASSEGRTCWLIDHRALPHAGFNTIWQAVKDGSGSKIVEMARG